MRVRADTTALLGPRRATRPKPSFDGPLACDLAYLERFEAGDFAPTAGLPWDDDDEDEDDDDEDESRGYRISPNGVAYVAINGPLAQTGGFYWDGHQSIGAKVRAAASDTRVAKLAFVINSPGGVTASMRDEAQSCRAALAASGKECFAFAREQAASAAFSWACVASKIFVSQDSTIGSVGVYRPMTDVTGANAAEGVKRVIVSSGIKKLDGHPDVKLTDSAVARVQADVDAIAGNLFAFVAASRGMSVDEVVAQDGATFRGPDAVQARLADAVMSWDSFVQMAEQAGKATRMQSIAMRLGLAATATEAEITAAVTVLQTRAEKSAADLIESNAARREFASTWAIETGRATVAEAGELRANVADASALERIFKARKAGQALPTESREPAGGPKQGGEGAHSEAHKALLAKDYGAMTNIERHSLAVADPSTFSRKRAEWADRTGNAHAVAQVAAPPAGYLPPAPTA